MGMDESKTESERSLLQKLRLVALNLLTTKAGHHDSKEHCDAGVEPTEKHHSNHGGAFGHPTADGMGQLTTEPTRNNWQTKGEKCDPENKQSPADKKCACYAAATRDPNEGYRAGQDDRSKGNCYLSD